MNDNWDKTPYHVSRSVSCSDWIPIAGVQIWTRIMKDVAADPWMSANVIFDILNEPDSYGLTWLPNGNQLAGKGLGYWYHQIMSTGYAINPSAPLPASCTPGSVLSGAAHILSMNNVPVPVCSARTMVWSVPWVTWVQCAGTPAASGCCCEH